MTGDSCRQGVGRRRRCIGQRGNGDTGLGKPAEGAEEFAVEKLGQCGPTIGVCLRSVPAVRNEYPAGLVSAEVAGGASRHLAFGELKESVGLVACLRQVQHDVLGVTPPEGEAVEGFVSLREWAGHSSNLGERPGGDGAFRIVSRRRSAPRQGALWDHQWFGAALRSGMALPSLFSKALAADALGVSTRTLDRLRMSGELESVLVGGQVRLLECSLEDYIERQRVGQPPGAQEDDFPIPVLVAAKRRETKRAA